MNLVRLPLYSGGSVGNLDCRSHTSDFRPKPRGYILRPPERRRVVYLHGSVERDVRRRSADVATLGNLCVDVVLSVPSLPPAEKKERMKYMEKLSASPPDKASPRLAFFFSFSLYFLYPVFSIVIFELMKGCSPSLWMKYWFWMTFGYWVGFMDEFWKDCVWWFGRKYSGLCCSIDKKLRMNLKNWCFFFHWTKYHRDFVFQWSLFGRRNLLNIISLVWFQTWKLNTNLEWINPKISSMCIAQS